MQQSRGGQFVLLDLSIDNIIIGALTDAILRIDVPSPNLSVGESDTTPLIVDSLYLQDTLNITSSLSVLHNWLMLDVSFSHFRHAQWNALPSSVVVLFLGSDVLFGHCGLITLFDDAYTFAEFLVTHFIRHLTEL